MELQKPKFKVLSKDEGKIVLGEEWTSTIQGITEHKLMEYAIERNTAFFTKLFEHMNKDELLACQRIIEANLVERFSYE